MFGPPGDPDFLALLTKELHAVLNGSGLQRTSDVEHSSGSSLPFASAFSLAGEDLTKLKAMNEWDDRPAIDKVLDLFIASMSHQQDRKPATENVRILAHLPGTCTIAIMLAISFTPLAAKDMADLTKVGRWSVAMRDVEAKVTCNWQGDLLDRQELMDAINGVLVACARYQAKYALKPIVAQRPGYGMGDFIGMGSAPPAFVPEVIDGPQG